MKKFKKCQVVMLPTKEKANFPFFVDTSENNRLSLNVGINKDKWNYDVVNPHHLYITSDDEIKESDWCVCEYQDGTYSVNLFKDSSGINKYKIVATTDSSLKISYWSKVNIDILYKSLPQPSQAFIQKYVEEYNKCNIITDVLVEYERFKERHGDRRQFFMSERLKVNTKDNTVTIKKVKDSWNNEDLKKFGLWLGVNYKKFKNKTINYIFDKWIEENL